MDRNGIFHLAPKLAMRVYPAPPRLDYCMAARWWSEHTRGSRIIQETGGLMVRRVQTRAGHAGYRDQLDRARRFLDRMEQTVDSWDEGGMTDVDFQDMVWAFFQNCWHVKDWVNHDPVVDQATKDGIIQRAHESVVLRVCQELCNGTKHLGARPGASHDHIDTTIVPGGLTIMDCLIDNGNGTLVSGRLLAHQCIGEWESIFRSHGLTTTRQS